MILISLSLLVLLSPSVSLSPCVCQMGFMYLIYLGEWATVETKAVRHILLARAVFKKADTHMHTHSRIHTRTHTCKFMHFKSFVDIVCGITGQTSSFYIL